MTMRIDLGRLLAAVLLLQLGAASPTHADEAKDRAELEAAALRWVHAFNGRDVGALAALATPGIVLLDPVGAPISGREAARKAWERMPKGQLTATSKESVVAGDVAWRIGSFAYKLPSGEVVSRGQTLEIWKRVDGRWKLHRQMPASMLAMQPVPRPQPSEPILDTPEPLLDTPRN
jgi:ketosteroid isomerase-like protein